MSRHEIPARDRSLRIVVGWDNPLRSFFAQIVRRDTADDDDGNPPILWVGAQPQEVVTVEDLARHLAPFADRTEDTAAQLRADRAAKRGQPPTALQQALLAAIRRPQ